jgi:hypothetical protein
LQPERSSSIATRDAALDKKEIRVGIIDRKANAEKIPLIRRMFDFHRFPVSVG